MLCIWCQRLRESSPFQHGAGCKLQAQAVLCACMAVCLLGSLPKPGPQMLLQCNERSLSGALHVLLEMAVRNACPELVIDRHKLYRDCLLKSSVSSVPPATWG